MPNNRRRRAAVSPTSSSDEAPINSQIVQPSTGQLSAGLPNPANSGQIAGSSQLSDSPRALDSALQALADRADDMTDDEEPIYRPSKNEVVERYSSDAGLSGESGLLSAEVVRLGFRV